LKLKKGAEKNGHWKQVGHSFLIFIQMNAIGSLAASIKIYDITGR
jgi:hypothetical protein